MIRNKKTSDQKLVSDQKLNNKIQTDIEAEHNEDSFDTSSLEEVFDENSKKKKMKKNQSSDSNLITSRQEAGDVISISSKQSKAEKDVIIEIDTDKIRLNKIVKLEPIPPITGSTMAEKWTSLKKFINSWSQVVHKTGSESISQRTTYFSDVLIKRDILDYLRYKSDYSEKLPNFAREQSGFRLKDHNVFIKDAISEWTIRDWLDVIYSVDNPMIHKVAFQQSLITALEVETAKEGVLFKFDPRDKDNDKVYLDSLNKIWKILSERSISTNTVDWTLLSTDDLEKLKLQIRKFFVNEKEPSIPNLQLFQTILEDVEAWASADEFKSAVIEIARMKIRDCQQYMLMYPEISKT